MSGTQQDNVNSLLKKISEIEPAINTVKKLQQSGILAVLDAVAEQSDTIFNYASTMDLLGAVSAFSRLVPVLSEVFGNIDMDELEERLRDVPWTTLIGMLMAFLEFLSTDMLSIEPPEGKVSTLHILSEMKSPGMEFLLRIAESLSTKVMDQIRKKQNIE